MECDPGANVDVEIVAEPELNAAVPNAVEPSLKVTLPVAAGSLVLAVNVTFAPTGAGLTSAVTTMVAAGGPGAGAAATIPRNPVVSAIKINVEKKAKAVV